MQDFYIFDVNIIIFTRLILIINY